MKSNTHRWGKGAARSLSQNARVAGIVFGLVYLSGCMFAPGMDMDKKGWQYHGPEVVSAPGISEVVELVPITQDLIKAQAENNNISLPAALVNDIDAANSDYKIGKDDVLSIVVWGQPELVATGGTEKSPLTARQVRDDGTIFFPYAGAVKVLDLTREQARQKLIAELDKFFKDPQVDVAIAEYNSQKVVVSGQVNQPLTIPLTAVGLTLGEAIAMAQGPTELADTTELKLLRDGGQEFTLNYAVLSKNGSAVQRITLQDKDIIQLPLTQSNKVYVVGDVGRPETLDVNSGSLTLTDALGAAEGVSPLSGSGNEVYVLRAGSANLRKPEVYSLDAKSPTAYLLSSQFILLPQDVVFVGPAELTKWNRVLSQIFPFANLVRVVDDVVNEPR